ncbi:hypothetical protein SAMN04487965_3437 [Microbulbifer donghaiensis]|uniref:Sporulation related domain-containing protein n=1 Tax=Microbulbifer donghaiensis TaxID=494016 RepID=A0A1M5HNY5_9GAMM|nr:hypothetical protein [Microbulbifer donghaiensis]SHG17650.1 hypothetical protein SAMN04487965_3437 [Microbulbifer donghaiensis]
MRWIVLALLFINIGVFTWFELDGRPAAKPVSSGAKPVAEAGERIALVAEVSPDQLAAARAAPKPAPVERQSAPPSAGQLCTLLGPFAEEYQGQDIVERLQALQVDGDLREIEMAGQMRYWVFLEPLNSRREAFRKLRELQSAGVDSYVIPKGSLANGISFGIFSELDRAESLVAELRDQGVDARSREEPQTYLERWIVLEPGAAGRLAESFWEQLQSEYPELDRRQNLCSEVKGG